MHISHIVALSAAEIFKFQLRAFDKVWSAIFKSDRRQRLRSLPRVVYRQA
jgi:hypothetical protein